MESDQINERSYGVIPFMIRNKVLHVLIIQHYSGAWLFPKGRAEEGEEGRKAAERELQEETGLSVERWLVHTPLIEQYQFWRRSKRIVKQAHYFAALVQGDLAIQPSEVKAARWELVERADRAVSFVQMKHLLTQIVEELRRTEPELF